MTRRAHCTYKFLENNKNIRAWRCVYINSCTLKQNMNNGIVHLAERNRKGARTIVSSHGTTHEKLHHRIYSRSSLGSFDHGFNVPVLSRWKWNTAIYFHSINFAYKLIKPATFFPYKLYYSACEGRRWPSTWIAGASAATGGGDVLRDHCRLLLGEAMPEFLRIKRLQRRECFLL